MESIREIFRIGYGPSSSHTMGPRKAAKLFKDKNPNAEKFRVTLFGSLAATGKGHLTDKAVLEELGAERTEIIWKPQEFKDRHPNALLLEAFDRNNTMIDSRLTYSIGGGAIIDEGQNKENKPKEVYPLANMKELLTWCKDNGRQYWEYVAEYEDNSIWQYLEEVWHVMQKAVERGVNNEGALPGGLNLQRKAASYFIKSKSYKSSLKRRSQLFAFALAVSEENAGGGLIVTAPTCGSSGVLPAVLYYMQLNHQVSKERIIRALATAGLIGNIVKKNASISGAEVGCQGEIGTACAMAAGAVAQLFGQTTSQIEYAAEMGLEHHLGLTCDPVAGLVQIPCIERNAFAAARAMDSASFAVVSDGIHRVSFDKIVSTMKQTGHDLPNIYRETSLGGLAHFAKNLKKDKA